ncbi:MAG: OFA family MFS transporter [Euryarchaeota archaeon]|nr:OFA family MFS transporter [Euryarchaeota archaeon]
MLHRPGGEGTAVAPRVPNRWVFVLVGFVANICLGTLYGWSVFKPFIHAEPYDIPLPDTTIPFSVSMLVFGVTFALAGRMISSMGPRVPALIGAVCAGAGYMLSGAIMFAPSAALPILTVTFGVVAGTGCGFGYNPPIAAVGRWFPDRRGLALGITVSGYALSPLITAPAVNFLASTYGIAYTFVILGVVFLVLLLVLGGMLVFPPADWKAPPVPAKTASKAWVAGSRDYTTREMLGTRTFYLAWFIYMVGAGAGLMVIGLTAQIAKDLTGLSGALAWMAVLAVQIYAVANASGRVAMGVVTDLIGPKRTILIMMVLQLVCLVALFPFATSVAVLFVVIILYGAMYGAYLSAMPALSSYFFGARNMGPNYGLLFAAWGVGGVVLPMVMARVLGNAPAHSDYIMGFQVTAAFVVAGLALALLMKPPAAPAGEKTPSTAGA